MNKDRDNIGGKMKELKTPSCQEIWDTIDSIEEEGDERIRQLSADLGELFHDFERQWLDHSSEHHVCEDCGFTINRNKHGICPASPE